MHIFPYIQNENQFTCTKHKAPDKNGGLQLTPEFWEVNMELFSCHPPDT